MKNTLFGALFVSMFLSFTGCSHSMAPHTGVIPTDITADIQDGVTDKTGYAEIICASAETEFYYVFPLSFGWVTPELTLTFNDESSFFPSSYEAVKIVPGKRDFTLTFKYGRNSWYTEIKQFEFEKNKKYFAKYSAYPIKIWIEKEDGIPLYTTEIK